MNRDLTVERTYALAQYQNIKLHDSITELPEEVLLNRELVSKIRYLQFLQLESDYRNYLKLVEMMSQYDMSTALQALEEEKINTIDLIKNIFNKKEE